MEPYISVNNLINANKTLSRRNKRLEERIHLLERQLITKEVAMLIDKWLDKPYENHRSEQKDIEIFAQRLTDFINKRTSDFVFSRLNNR